MRIFSTECSLLFANPSSHSQSRSQTLSPEHMLPCVCYVSLPPDLRLLLAWLRLLSKGLTSANQDLTAIVQRTEADLGELLQNVVRGPGCPTSRPGGCTGSAAVRVHNVRCTPSIGFRSAQKQGWELARLACAATHIGTALKMIPVLLAFSPLTMCFCTNIRELQCIRLSTC